MTGTKKVYVPYSLAQLTRSKVVTIAPRKPHECRTVWTEDGQAQRVCYDWTLTPITELQNIPMYATLNVTTPAGRTMELAAFIKALLPIYDKLKPHVKENYFTLLTKTVNELSEELKRFAILDDEINSTEYRNAKEIKCVNDDYRLYILDGMKFLTANGFVERTYFQTFTEQQADMLISQASRYDVSIPPALTLTYKEYYNANERLVVRYTQEQRQDERFYLDRIKFTEDEKRAKPNDTFYKTLGNRRANVEVHNLKLHTAIAVLIAQALAGLLEDKHQTMQPTFRRTDKLSAPTTAIEWNEWKYHNQLDELDQGREVSAPKLFYGSTSEYEELGLYNLGEWE